MHPRSSDFLGTFSARPIILPKQVKWHGRWAFDFITVSSKSRRVVNTEVEKDKQGVFHGKNERKARDRWLLLCFPLTANMDLHYHFWYQGALEWSDLISCYDCVYDGRLPSVVPAEQLASVPAPSSGPVLESPIQPGGRSTSVPAPLSSPVLESPIKPAVWSTSVPPVRCLHHYLSAIHAKTIMDQRGYQETYTLDVFELCIIQETTPAYHFAGQSWPILSSVCTIFTIPFFPPGHSSFWSLIFLDHQNGVFLSRAASPDTDLSIWQWCAQLIRILLLATCFWRQLFPMLWISGRNLVVAASLKIYVKNLSAT